MMPSKNDYWLVTIIGFLVGWLVLLPLKNAFNIPFNLSVVGLSVIGFTAFAPVALFLTKVVARWWPVFNQFGKFAAVGTLNTLLYLGVLNGLIFLTGIQRGPLFTLFAAISFLIATTNSYFWNKFWTFGNRLPVTIDEYVRFALFTLGGMIINASVASFVVNVLRKPEKINPAQWVNIGALTATAASFLWNFLSYKHFVFGSKTKNQN
jgi:putative flippase GtrA